MTDEITPALFNHLVELAALELNLDEAETADGYIVVPEIPHQNL